MAKLQRYVVDVYERASYPVVRHVFVGRTRREAYGYFESHLATDEFLRGCARARRWRTVSCRARAFWR